MSNNDPYIIMFTTCNAPKLEIDNEKGISNVKLNKAFSRNFFGFNQCNHCLDAISIIVGNETRKSSTLLVIFQNDDFNLQQIAVSVPSYFDTKHIQ